MGPSTRDSHAGCLIDDKVYIFGGKGKEETLGDFW